jgi:hypothetical protein
MLFNIIAVVVAFVLGAISMNRWNSKEEAKAKISPVELVNHYMDVERPTTISPHKVMEVVDGIGCCSTCSSEVVVGEVPAGTEFQCRCGALCFITLPAPPPKLEPVVVVATWFEVDGEAPTSPTWDGVERRKRERVQGKSWRAETREQMMRRG